MYLDGETLLFWIVGIVAVAGFVGFEQGKRVGRSEIEQKMLTRAYFEFEFPKVLASWPEELRNKFLAEMAKRKEKP